MKVDKITRLFSGQVESVVNNQAESTSLVQQAAVDSEAVTVSQSLTSNSAAQNSDDSARAAKVAQLKEAVKNGTYNPDSRQVASAVYQDLLA